MCKIPSYPGMLWFMYNIPWLFLPGICLSMISQKFKDQLNLMHSRKGFVCLLLFQQAHSSWVVGFLPFPLSDSLSDSCAGSVRNKKKNAITQHITIPQSRWEIMPHTWTVSNSFTLAILELNPIIFFMKASEHLGGQSKGMAVKTCLVATSLNSQLASAIATGETPH